MFSLELLEQYSCTQKRDSSEFVTNPVLVTFCNNTILSTFILGKTKFFAYTEGYLAIAR